MNDQQLYFLNIIRDCLESNESTVKDIEWRDIVLYAKKHQLEAIIYYQTKLPSLRAAYNFQVYYNTNRQKELDEIKERLANIDFFVVKGPVLAEIYSYPWLRSMGDIDLVVKEKDRKTVDYILCQLGYESREKESDVWHYIKNGWDLELHDRLLDEDEINPSKMACYFNNCWEWVKGKKLDWNFHFLFLIAHLRKHLVYEGVGFRQFIDIAVVTKSGLIDWTVVEKVADEIEMDTFMRVVLALNKRWFGINVPIDTPSIDEQFFTEATEKIFENGVFGFDNADNKINKAVNIARVRGNWGIISRLKEIVFPPYNKMIRCPEYNFLLGKKWLLPVAWFFRIVRKWKHRKIVYDSYLIPKSRHQTRIDTLDKWGL